MTRIDLSIRPWEDAAAVLLGEFDADPWIDFGRRAADGGLPVLVGREVHVSWAGIQPVGLVVLDDGVCGLEMTLGVDPSWRRRGVASQLLDFGRGRAFDLGKTLFVLVDAENRGAREFFEVAGLDAEVVGEGHVRFTS